MPTSDKLLELLRSEQGHFFSGEELASKLSVSRASVWKAVKKLQSEGNNIKGVTNKGYCFLDGADNASEDGLRELLDSNISDNEIDILKTVSSTNSYLKEQAERGAPDGKIVIADRQSCGRGRFGREFFSPGATGVYLSLLLRPKEMTASQSGRITAVAAAAVCEAIERISGKRALIKWVNDIFADGKKVCGILTEGTFDMETGFLSYAVMGIGLNLYEPAEGFPETLLDRAGYVLDKRRAGAKNEFIAYFLNSFYRLFADETCEYVKIYRKRCFVIGRDVRLISGGSEQTAHVLDVDDECRLIVRLSDGTKKIFSGGEISLDI